MTNASSAATATAPSDSASVPLPGTGAKLMARISAATSRTDTTPPRLSTGSEVSWTCAGTYLSAIGNATSTSGSVTTKTDPQSKCSSSAPEISGPSEAIAPPMADHNAIALVRPGPDHSAVISARVVG
jgi:hypothetical protein